MISALFKPHLKGDVHVSNLPDRVIVGFFVSGRTRFYVSWKETEGNVRPPDRAALRRTDRPQLRARSPRTPTRRSATASWACSVSVSPGTSESAGLTDPADPSLPAHLDLLDTAFYRISDPNFVLVEFTTRGPIRPAPGRELWSTVLHLDTDRPWSDPSRERDDRDLLLECQPRCRTGRPSATWKCCTGAARG